MISSHGGFLTNTIVNDIPDFSHFYEHFITGNRVGSVARLLSQIISLSNKSRIEVRLKIEDNIFQPKSEKQRFSNVSQGTKIPPSACNLSEI